MYEIKLYLYVVDHSPPSLSAAENLKRVLGKKFKDQYTLEIIDLFENPELAQKEKVFATPTVVKISPEPVRRVIGDLKDPEKVLLGLGLPVDE